MTRVWPITAAAALKFKWILSCNNLLRL
jgi:hypothetical protein